MAIIYISNGKKTFRCEEAQSDLFLNRENEDWKIVPNPNPPPPTEEELRLADHTNQVPIKHTASGKQTWCEKGQLKTMLAHGWELIDPKDAPAEEKPTAEDLARAKAKEEADTEAKLRAKAKEDAEKFEANEEISALRKVLEGIDHSDDSMWNSKGEINITSLRALVPNVTRKEVEAVIPGFHRSQG